MVQQMRAVMRGDDPEPPLMKATPMADPISFLDARLRRLEVLRLQALRRAGGVGVHAP
jgi:hypothetical protein